MVAAALAAAVVLVGAATAWAARPVARWDVVPDQVMNKVFCVGVCAFHADGVKVEFRVGGTLVATINNPTYNPQTNVWEFWFPLNPADYADGPLAITARAIALDAAGTTYDLPSLNLYANSRGSLTGNTVKWADAVNGSDSNPGTEALPYQTLAKAVQNTPSGGTVNLKAGTYSSQSLGGGSSRPYWTTIQAAPDLGWNDVEVTPGRPGTQRLRWKDLTLSIDTTASYATILSGENGSHSVWIDNVKAYNKQGRWGGGAITFGNRYVAYVTGGLTTEMSNGPGASIIRNHTMTRITSDAWTGGEKLVVNSSVTDIDPGTTGAHPDFHQSYCVAPDWVENVILYNVRGYECISQGLFGSRLRNAAFVNVLMEKVNTVMYSQYSGPMENVLFLHMDIISQSWLWRGTGTNAYTATEVSSLNNVFHTMGLAEDATAAGLTIDRNHFVGTTGMGDNRTTGDARFVDAASNNYRLAADSPAWGTARALQCVPADIDGNPFGASRNRGCYAQSIPATGQVAGWDLVATFGPAGAQTRAVADGAVHSSQAPLTVLRLRAGAAIDPATLWPGSVTLAAQKAGDRSSLIQSLTLADGGATVVVALTGPLPDGDRYTLTLGPDVRTTGGKAFGGDVALTFGVLLGDVDGSGSVTEADAVAVRDAAGKAIAGETSRFDVDASGSITGTDMATVRSRIGQSIP
jgi:hypothetical protein